MSYFYKVRVFFYLLFLVCFGYPQEVKAKNDAISKVHYNTADPALSSTLVNQSNPTSESAGITPFSVLDFELRDAGGDGLATSLTKLVFEVKDNTFGLADADDHRLEDVLTGMYIHNKTTGINLIPQQVQFSDFQTVVLLFADEQISVAEGGSASFSFMAELMATAPVQDNEKLSLVTRVQDFATGAASSGLVPDQENLAGSLITFNFQATALEVEGEPAIIKADKPSTPALEGEFFTITVIAVDVNGRLDIDFNDDLSLGIQNTAGGRDLFGDAYISMVAGNATFSGLQYSSNQLPESFILTISGTLFAGDPVFSSSPIYAVASQDNTSVITAVIGSGTPNFIYANYQESENLTLSTSVSLGAFKITDSPESGPSDGLETKIKALELQLTNAENLRTIALFNGTSLIKEQAVDLEGNGIFRFDGLNVAVANNSSLEMTIRATFKPIVTDNEKISVGIYRVESEGISSKFKYLNPGEPINLDAAIIGNNSLDDVNRLEVKASTLNFLSIPSNAELNVPFALSLEAVDGLGNRDLDESSSISFSKASGTGDVLPQPFSASLSAGFLSTNALSINGTGSYSIMADDSGPSISPVTSGNFRVFERYTYEGILISEIAYGNNAGTPKYLEITNTSATNAYGLENLRVRIYENGSTTATKEVDLLNGALLNPGESFVLSNVAFNTSWGGAFATETADQVDAGIAGDGNDVYELYDYFRNIVLDVYGEKGINGTGKSWDYTEKLVNRKSRVGNGNSGTFDVSQFTIVPYANGLATPGSSSTADATKPSLVGATPASGSQSVLESSAFTLTFSEPLNFESGKVHFKKSGSNTLVYTADITNNAVISGEGTKVLTITPASLLPGLTELTIEVEAGAVTDLAGNNLATFSYQFKTTDTIKPTIVSLSPADNAVNVALESKFRIEFSEAVVPGSGSFTFWDLASGEPVASIGITSEQLSQPEPHIIEFQIPYPLERLREFYILAEEGIVKDAGANSFAGFTTADAWSFKTVDPFANSPKIVKLDPAKGETHVMQNHKPLVKFNEPIAAGTGRVELYTSAGVLVKSLNMASSEGLTISGNEATFDFGPLEFNTSYFVVLQTGSLTDPDGNPIEGFTDNLSWAFTTVENNDPVIVVQSEKDPLYFGSVAANTESLVKVYKLGGRNLNQPVTLDIPSPFKISLDGGNTFKTGSVVLQPNELLGFKEVVVKFAPVTANGTLFQAKLVHQSTGAKTKELGLLGREGAQPQTISIAEARALGVGAEVEITGVVTLGSQFENNLRYLQDGSGAIAVYEGGNLLAGLKKGDRVKVKGTISESSGKLLQIGEAGLQVQVLESEVALPEPQVVYVNEQSDLIESKLVKVQNIQFERAGQEFQLYQFYNFTDTKGVQGTLKIEGPTNSLANTKIPTVASVTAILTQDNSYYLLPRDLNDLEERKPEISLSYPDGKLNFGFVEAGKKATPLRLRVSTKDLAEEITISVPAPFGVSTNSVFFSQSITIPLTTGYTDIWINFMPTLADGNIYKSEVRLNSSSAPEVKAAVAGVEGKKPELLTIAQARVLPLGEKVKVKGILSSGNTISFTERYMQDGTGGIVTHLAGDQAFSALAIGAEIKVEGTLKEIKGLLQIGNVSDWELLNNNVGEPATQIISASAFGEENEARLVMIRDIQFVEEGVFKAGTTYHFLFPGNEKGLVTIPAGSHPLVGERLPYLASITGVLSETGEGYTLIPRKKEDLMAADAIVTASFPEGDLKFLFIPAGQTSAAKSFKVKGERLEGDITLSVSAPFQLSTDGTNFGLVGTIAKANAADATVFVRYSPTLAGGGVSENFVTLSTAKGRPLQVPVTGIEGARPAILTIAQARALGAGEAVKFRGVLTTGSSFFAGKRFVQDETGGLLIVAENSALAGFEAGDKVELSGTLENIGNLLQVSKGTSISLIQKSAGVPAANAVSAADQLDERNEAELLHIPSIRFSSAGFFEKGKVYPVYFESGEQANLRVSGDNNSLVGELIPELAKLTAVLVQQENEYHLLPRSKADVEAISYHKAIIVGVAENGFDFGVMPAGTPSGAETYTVTGTGLSGKITIAVGAPFQLSLDGTSWGQSLEVEGNSSKKTVYVRFNPTTANGQLIALEITHSADGKQQVISVRGKEGSIGAEIAGPDYVENFDQCLDLNTFTTFDKDGHEQWQCAEGWGLGKSGAVGIHHTRKEPEANEDWLISPSIEIMTASRLAVDIARQHAGPDLEVLVSANYNGAGNPTLVSWEALPISIPAPASSLSEFENISNVDLSAYAGQNVHIAFKYTSTFEEASAYLIDNFSIQTMSLVGLEETTPTTLQEGNSAQITFSLSQPAKQASSLRVKIQNGNGVTYGEQGDYKTTPALNNEGEVVLEVQEGQQEVSFELTAMDDLLEEAEEQLNLQLMEVGPGLLINEAVREMDLVLQSNNAESMVIATARQVDDQGILQKENKLVKVKGAAYGPNLSMVSGGLEFRLIDHSPEAPGAITVALATASALSYSLKQGDELEVTGVLRNIDGLATIEPQTITVLKLGEKLKEPVKATTLDESNESFLLMLDQVEVASGWQNSPVAAFDVKVKNGEGKEFVVQIRPGTDLYGTEKPAGKISVVGFGAQKDLSKPYSEGYYLIPRSKADVQKPTGVDKELEVVELSLYPNPTHGQFYIRSTESARFERVQLISANGKVILNTDFEEEKAFETEGLSSGIYIVKILLKGGTFTVSRLSIIR